ncbi:hypothetical protein M885DRAFT_611205 [Pelagophyceae sp. CCMP2097]|nr:hypothetical protein M885DRAFT_611205 [Pelagophyceae sp. CCMP2097]
MIATDLKGLRAQAAVECANLQEARLHLEAAARAARDACQAALDSSDALRADATRARAKADADAEALRRELTRGERSAEATSAKAAARRDSAAAADLTLEAEACAARAADRARASLAEVDVHAALEAAADARDADAEAALALCRRLAAHAAPGKLAKPPQRRRGPPADAARRVHARRLAARTLAGWGRLAAAARHGRCVAAARLVRLVRLVVSEWRRFALANALADCYSRRAGLRRGARAWIAHARRRRGASAASDRAAAWWSRRQQKVAQRFVLSQWRARVEAARLERVALDWHHNKFAMAQKSARTSTHRDVHEDEQLRVEQNRRLVDLSLLRRRCRIVRKCFDEWRTCTTVRRDALRSALRHLRIRARARVAAHALARRAVALADSLMLRAALRRLWRVSDFRASVRLDVARARARRGLRALRRAAAVRRLRRLDVARRNARARRGHAMKLAAKCFAAWARASVADVAPTLAALRRATDRLGRDLQAAHAAWSLASAASVSAADQASAADATKYRYAAEADAQKRRLRTLVSRTAAAGAALSACERFEAADEAARAALAGVEAALAREHASVLLRATAKVDERVAQTRRLEALCAQLDASSQAARQQRVTKEAELRLHADRDAKSLNAALAAARSLAGLIRRADQDEVDLGSEREALAARLEALAERLRSARVDSASLRGAERAELVKQYEANAALQFALSRDQAASGEACRAMADAHCAGAPGAPAALRDDLVAALEAKRDRLRSQALKAALSDDSANTTPTTTPSTKGDASLAL